MRGYAMLKIGQSGWVEKDKPDCGPGDALCTPLAVAICTSDIHTLWEGAIGEWHNLILGHECCAKVVEVGSRVKDFKPGDKVLVPAITPDWNSLEAQAGYSMHSGGMLAGWKFSNTKDGVFAEIFHVNDAGGDCDTFASALSRCSNPAAKSAMSIIWVPASASAFPMKRGLKRRAFSSGIRLPSANHLVLFLRAVVFGVF
jgi:NADPH:quinone reductase-like Zn-dependent oxidoreductase